MSVIQLIFKKYCLESVCSKSGDHSVFALLLTRFISMERYFSNSLIIHQEKTKKITTATAVWISDPNYHKIFPTLALNFSKNYWSFEKPYQTLESVFHQISKQLEVVLKNSAAPRFFNLLLSVWISDGTLFAVFDILHQTRGRMFHLISKHRKVGSKNKTQPRFLKVTSVWFQFGWKFFRFLDVASQTHANYYDNNIFSSR